VRGSSAHRGDANERDAQRRNLPGVREALTGCDPVEDGPEGIKLLGVRLAVPNARETGGAGRSGGALLPVRRRPA
jgi:hypothetical protein